MIKVAVIFGTRPEAIKLAPVIQALESRPGQFQCCTWSTSQHREMLDQVLSTFAIRPDHDLHVMSPDQSLAQVASRVLDGVDQLLAAETPDWVLVQGDTTTVMAASLAAFYRHVKVGHVEAGLRSGDRSNPFPEEINRRVAGVTADLHFAPTANARQALLREGTPDWRIVVTGNTVIDALLSVAARPYKPDTDDQRLRRVWDARRRIVLVTAHRRESFGLPLRDIFLALRELAHRFADDVLIVYPVHMNPNVAGPAHELLDGIANIALLPPLDYVAFTHLMKRSYLVLTDSGGIQEEAPSLGKPVLVMRDVTERPEAIQAGAARLVGTHYETIVAAVTTLLTDATVYGRMATATNPYGDGHASRRIADAIAEFETRAAVADRLAHQDRPV